MKHLLKIYCCPLEENGFAPASLIWYKYIPYGILDIVVHLTG